MREREREKKKKKECLVSIDNAGIVYIPCSQHVAGIATKKKKKKKHERKKLRTVLEIIYKASFISF